MTHGYAGTLLSVWALYAFAALVPGPNAICVTSSALLGGTSRGLAAAAGVASATLIWAALGISGINVALRAHPETMRLLHYGGAAVLLWLGWTTLRGAPGDTRHGTRGGGYLQGLLTGCSNPISAAVWTTSAGYILATAPSPAEVAVYVGSCAALALALHGAIALAVARLSGLRDLLDRGTLRTFCGTAFVFLAGVMAVS